MRARGITVLVKTKEFVKNIETKQLYLVKSRLKPFFASKKPALFATTEWAITYSLVVA